MFAFLIYLACKVIIYSGVCALLRNFYQFPKTSLIEFSVKWGTLRLLIGILFSIPILMTFAILKLDNLPDWQIGAIVLTPYRFLEWAVLFWLIKRKHDISWNNKITVWLLIAVCASFISDVIALLTGANNIKLWC